MVQFDKIQNGKAYFGFTKDEIRFILEELEKEQPENDITKRLDVLYLGLSKRTDWE